MKAVCFSMKRIADGISALLLLVAAVMAFMPAAYAAEVPAAKTVRVAIDDSNIFMKLNKEKKPVSGFGYEYVETIAAYSGWKVQYVFGSGFKDCLQMAIDGRADIVYDVSFSAERAEKLLYPDMVMGHEEYYLYCMPGNPEIRATDYASYDKKRVGVTAGTLQIEELKKWCRGKGISLNFVEYVSFQEKEKALRNGEIDFNFEISMLVNKDFSALDKIASDSYYMVVNKNRPDLLADVNAACTKIVATDRKFFENLDNKYFSKSLVSKTLLAEEAVWVSRHDTLTVGYLNHYLPFSNTDRDGNVAGLVKDIVPLMFKNIGVGDAFRVKYAGFDDNEELYSSLARGETDCIFPVCGDLSFAISKNAFFSSSVLGIEVDLAYKGSYSPDTTATVAVNKKNQLQDFYTRHYYPDSKVIYFDTIGECLEAVINGKAGSTILNGMRTADLLRDSRYSGLHTVRLPQNVKLCFAVKKGNPALLSLINRAIANTDDSAVVTLSYNYLQSGAYTIEQFVKEHIWVVVFVAIVFVAAIALLYFNRKLSESGEQLLIQKEAAQKAREEADAANSSKTNFLFNMSHDVRTPLNAITGFTMMAKKYLDDKEKVADYLSKIDASGQQLLSLVNQVLEMSRIEAGKVEFNNQPIDIKEKYDSMVTILAAQATVNGLEFRHSLQEIKHRRVLADDAKMGQITLNIAGNAIKYTPEGGKIDFTLRETDCERAGFARYVLTVADTGIGMSKEFQKVMFEPFSREKSSTVSHIQGTGLGMPIVKNLIELLGGRIEVQSAPGKGTRFDVTVDFELIDETENPAEAEETRTVDAAAFKGKRILLVEDNELNREIAKDILEEFGIVVEEAVDGDVAVDMVRTADERGEYNYYDLVLMDIQMPRMNGYEATRAIRKLSDPSGTHLPIIAMTANAFEEDRKNAMEAGMDGHLAKPIDIGKLLAALAKYL